MITTTVLASDLQPGDVLITTAIGGYEGEIHSVRVYPTYVAVGLQSGGACALGPYEVCSVERRATVHPLRARGE